MKPSPKKKQRVRRSILLERDLDAAIRRIAETEGRRFSQQCAWMLEVADRWHRGATSPNDRDFRWGRPRRRKTAYLRLVPAPGTEKR